jgi:tetratricopeptide (TPR) repeat protein
VSRDGDRAAPEGGAAAPAAGRGGRRTTWSLALLVLLSGCAYYNGMYNAKRWSRAAERSERAGRTGEARDRWQRASIHAESLTTRHPHSRWADDAMLVRGRAALHLGLYVEAAALLRQAADRAGDPEQRLEALLLLGRAHLALRRYPDARAVLDTAAGSSSRDRRAEALLYHARTLLAMGDPADALADLRASTHPDARFERARAALALRDTALAAATFDSLVTQRPYAEWDWLPALDSLSAAGARPRAAGLVDALTSRTDIGRGDRARLLLADGGRAMDAGNTTAARERFHAIQDLVPDSAEARSAGVRLARGELGAAGSDSEVVAVRERLFTLAQQGGTPAREAQQILRLLGKADSLGRMPVDPDAFWYLHAEVLRDSLGAPGLAAAAFAAMAERFPDSPWTPKGLLAAIAAGYPAPDTLRTLLQERYPESPYTTALLGGNAERYASLEDSLLRVLERRPAAGRPGVTRPAANPAAVEQLEDEERVGGRRPPAPARPGQRPPTPTPAPRPATPPRPRPGDPVRP